MKVTRFEPWSLLNLTHRDFDRIAARPAADDVGQSVADWAPAVDILEGKDRFVLKADLPGISADDIDVSMEDGVLSLSGERTHETSEETSRTRFSRRISMPFR